MHEQVELRGSEVHEVQNPWRSYKDGLMCRRLSILIYIHFDKNFNIRFNIQLKMRRSRCVPQAVQPEDWRGHCTSSRSRAPLQMDRRSSAAIGTSGRVPEAMEPEDRLRHCTSSPSRAPRQPATVLQMYGRRSAAACHGLWKSCRSSRRPAAPALLLLHRL